MKDTKITAVQMVKFFLSVIVSVTVWLLVTGLFVVLTINSGMRTVGEMGFYVFLTTIVPFLAAYWSLEVLDYLMEAISKWKK